jgi:AraC family transcriptional regulator of adaptative response/methylated-DNA-[protein]-cysteine methyltransferase
MESTMSDYRQMSEDYRRIEQAILFLEANAGRQPELKEVAESVHLSEYHFQRLFTRWAGISPKKFLQYLTKENAKNMLERSASLLDTAYASGLSGPGRLHDLFVTCEAVTPGEYKARGAGLTIRFGYHYTPFGECLLAITERGLCYLAFISNEDYSAALQDLNAAFHAAEFVEDAEATAPYVQHIFSTAAEERSLPLHLHLLGTNFQIKVWEALLHIPQGQAITYGELAASVGEPGASRAVGRAVGKNPIAVLIPCHRVIRKLGSFGGYRYGPARKKALLGWEMAHTH